MPGLIGTDRKRIIIMGCSWWQCVFAGDLTLNADG